MRLALAAGSSRSVLTQMPQLVLGTQEGRQPKRSCVLCALKSAFSQGPLPSGTVAAGQRRGLGSGIHSQHPIPLGLGFPISDQGLRTMGPSASGE